MIFLAFRYLFERRKQTLFTFLGVFFGTVAYVGVSGFFKGFQGFLVEQLVNNSAQVHIQARQDYLMEHQLDSAFYGNIFKYVFWEARPSGLQGYLGVQDPQSWYERLNEDPRVEAYSPLLTAPSLFSLGKVSVSASLNGCNPAQQARVTSISDYMTEGKFTDIGAGGNRIILGVELMKRLGAQVNQTISVSVNAKSSTPFKVVGIFYTGNRNADLQAWGSLADIQRINRTPNRINEIGVRLTDYTQAASIATAWTEIAPETTKSWDQLFVNMLAMFAVQNALRFTMIMTVLIVAGFGIYNVLNMTVTQKRQDIAILRSMGYDTFDIVMLFFSQGFILGICGAALGLIAGYLLCYYIQTIQFMAVTPTNPQGHLHISMDYKIYVQATLLALLSASIASILPARAAGQLTPIDIIRSGT